MNRIRLLPEQVANQIAAGEVIERPASVVKELVENSLDAQATRLTVEIQAGGRSLIRVTDDGAGMSRDDALLCLERHATSKIARAEDLSTIATMGFRGEALPSIASVSRFTLTTRERGSDSPEGTQVIVNGGKIASVKACGSPPGASVEVRQLFFNLPARRKFLRAEETESAHIQHYVALAALAYPAVAIEFLKDTRPVWQLPAVKTPDKLAALRERLRALSGSEDKLLPVDFSVELPEIDGEEETEAPAPSASLFAVWGFIGAPGVSRATRQDQHVFVNRRPVENRGINFALLEGYHTALMKGRYPVCCLFIQINPAEADVNIHPAKREIRFHREKTVRQLLAQAVRETLLQFHTAPMVNAPAPRPQQPPPVPPPRPEPADLPDFPRLSRPLADWPAPPRPVVQPPSPAPSALTLQPSAFPPPSALLQVPLRVVGVVGRLYVVLESDRGLVLLDQHAAHERILFEQMLRRLEESGPAPSQRLLLPETVELTARDAQFLREQLPALTRLGVGLAEFGERTFLLDALPPYVKVSNPRRFILELVDELKAAGQSVNALRLGEHTIAKTVCRHAVKANDLLAGPELENLIQDLRHCAMPYTCPHGRPTLIEMNFRELEKKFGRSQ
ncbi:MAG TPA: DNA mismatch repair endonuclease MutL [Candidatus Saccharimonadales bacterium]|jgi:DNA mismatch repair protein MutL|nr:DNA mismatch repair endonuclease MutL [Candidatus Saccharimonadales bacterium]